MSFLDKVQKSWNDGAKAIIPGDNGIDIPLQIGINYVKNVARKNEDKKALSEKNNQKETEKVK